MDTKPTRTDRIIEKFKDKDFTNATPHAELLEFLLSPFFDRPAEMADKLIEEYGNISHLLNMDESELLSIKGMKKDAAFQLSLNYPLITRAILSNPELKRGLVDIERVKAFFIASLQSQSVEEMRVLCLDEKGRYICSFIAAKGQTGRVICDINSIVKKCIYNKARYIYLAHNHTSTEISPSENDLRLTDNAYKALHAVGIALLDHIIVRRGSAYSIFTQGDYTPPKVIT